MQLGGQGGCARRSARPTAARAISRTNANATVSSACISASLDWSDSSQVPNMAERVRRGAAAVVAVFVGTPGGDAGPRGASAAQRHSVASTPSPSTHGNGSLLDGVSTCGPRSMIVSVSVE